MITLERGDNLNLYKLKAARVARGMKAVELAKLLGVTPDMYYRKERGATKFSIDEFRRIVFILNLTMVEINDILFGGCVPNGT